jgi:hypothetical protein
LFVTLGEDTLCGTLSGGRAGADLLDLAGTRDTFADKKDQEAQARLDTLRGLYNVALLEDGHSCPSLASETTDTNVRSPVGYLTLKIGDLGKVKIAGKLFDGTSFSGSGKLLEGLSDISNDFPPLLAVALHRPLYLKKGFISGLLWINPVDKTVLLDTEYGWFVDWVRDADPKKPGLDFQRELDLLGGRFGDGKTAVMPLPGLAFTADVAAAELPAVVAGLPGVWADAAFPWQMPVTATGTKLALPKASKPVKGELGYEYPGANPSSARITYTAKTGLFKGEFKVYYDATDAKQTHKTVNVSYTGVMVPVEGVLTGLGFGVVTVEKQKHAIPVVLQVE